MSRKQLIKFCRWLFALVIVALLFYLSETEEIANIDSGETPVLYANEVLPRLFLEAIQSAQENIFLKIYSLSDEKVIEALNLQSERGISVKVIHDGKTPQYGFDRLSPLIRKESAQLSGLMHQKILIIDDEKVWIGSANLTTESLRLHDNLVVGLINHQLAESIVRSRGHLQFTSGGQKLEFWSFPQEGKRGLERLLQLIEGAEESIRVAMFTWTHPLLTEAVISAHKRGVKVEVLLDRDQAFAVSYKALKALKEGGVNVHLSSGIGLLHHKFAWIDEKTLVNGSANWTKSAFKRNSDCLLILHSLLPEQNATMREVWWKLRKRCSSNKEHFSVFGQRPELIGDHLFEAIDMAA